MSVIARGRACVRTEQYRHSEVMRSVGRSHIKRCERAAAAQAMYDPCYYLVADPSRLRASPNAPSIASHGPILAAFGSGDDGNGLGCGGRRTSQGVECTDTRGQTLREDRGAGTPVAYRGANGPSLLTKQAHSTSQYPQCSHYQGGRGWWRSWFSGGEGKRGGTLGGNIIILN